MRTYLVCDQDGFVADTQEGNIAHYATNPTHTSHVGIGGDSSTPVPYTGSSGISEVDTDPSSPTPGTMWLKANGRVGTAGQAMGVLGLTYSQSEVASYQLSIKTSEGPIVRVGVS